MAKYAPPGNTEVHWVTTITDYLIPTSTLLNAGVDITAWVRNISLPRTLNRSTWHRLGV
jgi:hypothetical protein